MTGSNGDRGWAGGLRQWLMKGRAAWMSSRGERQLELIETLPLGGRRQLALVRCGDEEILIGLGGDSVQSMLRMSGKGAGAAVEGGS